MTAERTAALVLLVVGTLTGVAAYDHELGTIERIGPGTFPLVASVALGMASLALLVRSRGPAPDRAIRPGSFARTALPVLGGLLAFAFLLPALGLAPAAFALVMISSRSERSRVVPTVILALTISLLGAALFIGALGVRIRIIGN